MRGVSETEEFLERLFRPFALLLQWVSRWWIFRQLVRLLAFLSGPFRAVWYRFWSYVLADEMPSRLGIAQRASYQRIYIPAYLMIGVCVVVVIFGILLGEPTMVTITNARQPVTVVDMYVPDKAKTTDSDLFPGAKQNVPQLVQQGSGFLGFVDLRPRTKNLPELRISVPSGIYAVDPTADFISDDPISYSPVEGDRDTVVIPVDADYVWTEATKELPKSISRDIQVAYRVDPEYPFVARDEDKEGEIVVLVYIDSTGQLSIFPDWVTGEGIQTLEYSVKGGIKTINYAVHENPTGWYFARNFIKVLPGWLFIPRIVDGKPAGGLLRIKYIFCLGIGCTKLELLQVES